MSIRLAPWLLVLAAASCSESVARVGPATSVSLPAEDPGDFGRVPPFHLTDSRGEVVTEKTLAGRPYALAAIFTSCTGPCPTISGHMREVQAALAGTGARLVSVTVDPEHDSPEELAAYAAGYGAEPDRWLFLTGNVEEVDALVRGGFRLAVDRSSPGSAPAGQRVTHATKIVAVDGQGLIRGWYDGRTPEGIAALVARLRFLAGQGH